MAYRPHQGQKPDCCRPFVDAKYTEITVTSYTRILVRALYDTISSG